ncbi:MAG: hypothetical protein IT310_09725 [Anaerolineales bacterium]|nr:hypothetical protein [Anaerolineales bacterium]
MKKFLCLLVLVGVSLACAGGPPATEQPADLDAVVQATFAALTAQAATVATAEPLATATQPAEQPATSESVPTTEPLGSIAGTLSYPSEQIPPLMIVAYGEDGYYNYILTMAGEGVYQMDNLPVGTYQVVAYTMDGELSAGYSQAVPCGLSVDCPDHSLISVTVTADEVTQNINPQDWYAPEGSFPPMPAQ